jgi:hypothetical protein
MTGVREVVHVGSIVSAIRPRLTQPIPLAVPRPSKHRGRMNPFAGITHFMTHPEPPRAETIPGPAIVPEPVPDPVPDPVPEAPPEPGPVRIPEPSPPQIPEPTPQ